MPIKTIANKARTKGIPGISAAHFKSSSEITSYCYGTLHCNLRYFSDKTELSEKEQSDLVKNWDSQCYILTKSSLYYYNGNSKLLKKIDIKQEDVDAILKMLRQNKDLSKQVITEFLSLSPEQLSFIEKITGHHSEKEKISKDTPFNVASLSKPVFFYLVHHLIHLSRAEKRALNLENLSLQSKLVDYLPEVAKKDPRINEITIEMIMSHATGIADATESGKKAPLTVFKPGSEIAYSNWALVYLQLALEKQAGHSLETLMQKYVFNDKQFKHASYLRPKFKAVPTSKKDLFPLDPTTDMQSIACNSLRITTAEYALFMQNWLKNMKTWHGGPKGLSNYLNKIALPSTKERWATTTGASSEHIKCGGGFFFHTDKSGDVDMIFHNGDMNEWRTLCFMNPQTGEGLVYFTNSDKGMELASTILKELSTLDARPTLDYIQTKLDFNVKDLSSDSRKSTSEKIGVYFKSLGTRHQHRQHRLQFIKTQALLQSPELMMLPEHPTRIKSNL